MSEPLDGINTIAVDPTGKMVAAGGQDKTIRIWALEAKSGRLLRSQIAHEDAASRTCFDEIPDRRPSHARPEIRDAARQRFPERWAQVRRGDVIAVESDRRPSRVVTILRVVEGRLHVVGECDRSTRANPRDDPIAELPHAVEGIWQLKAARDP